jgi:hypothetical protein
VKLLVENSRLTALPEIAEQFHALKNAREGSSDARSPVHSRWTPRRRTNWSPRSNASSAAS